MVTVPASNHAWFDGNDLTFKISSTVFAPWTYLFINLPAVLAYQKGLYIYFMIEQDSLKPNTYELETRNIVYDINI